MTQEIFLLIGVPGSGKSWVCERLQADYQYISHDAHIGGSYIPAIIDAARQGNRPVLIETPFSMMQIMEPLEQEGLTITPIFVIANEDRLEERWNSRGTPPSSRKGHLTRQQTYRQRALERGAFLGNASDALSHLKSIASERAQ